MADHDRWTNDRDRGRSVNEDEAHRGYSDYGRRTEYGRSNERRTFGGEFDDDVYGAGYGRSPERAQGQGSRYSQSQDRGVSRASWDRSSYGQSPQGGYSQSAYARGAQGGYGGYGDQGAYGPDAGRGSSAYGGQYRGGSYDPRQNEHSAYGSDTGRYGGALGYGGLDSGYAPRYADPDWSPRHNERDEHRGWMERTGDKIANFFGADTHRGRGPKNYTRSDERIRDDVNDRLTDDPYLDASEIDVTASAGEVTLTGTVHSRDEKRRAEDLAEQVSGARHVQNNLRVQQPSYGATGYGASSATGASSAPSATVTDATTGKNGTVRGN